VVILLTLFIAMLFITETRMLMLTILNVMLGTLSLALSSGLLIFIISLAISYG